MKRFAEILLSATRCPFVPAQGMTMRGEVRVGTITSPATSPRHYLLGWANASDSSCPFTGGSPGG